MFNIHIPHNRVFRVGPFAISYDVGKALLRGDMMFGTSLVAEHRDPMGRIIHRYDLGSGKVTNVGVLALANDWNWANNAQTVKLANFHAWGTGTNAELASDITLQTLAAPTTATAVTGAQTTLTAALSATSGGSNQKYQTAATITAGGALAITEWGLFTAAALSATTGSPLTACSATLATATATPYTASSASVQGQQQMIVVPGTTTVYGLVYSNTTSALTVVPSGAAAGWWTVAAGLAGSTPGATETFALKPVMLDRRQFAVINLNTSDSITFTYQLTLPSGG